MNTHFVSNDILSYFKIYMTQTCSTLHVSTNNPEFKCLWWQTLLKILLDKGENAGNHYFSHTDIFHPFHAKFIVLSHIYLLSTTAFILSQMSLIGWQRLNPFPNIKFYTFPNWRSLQMTISNLMKMAESSWNGQKTRWEKKKLLVMSNFSFSHSVFQILVQQTHKNQGLFGKGLNTIQVFQNY